jgi:hypothetical protein
MEIDDYGRTIYFRDAQETLNGINFGEVFSNNPPWILFTLFNFWQTRPGTGRLSSEQLLSKCSHVSSWQRGSLMIFYCIWYRTEHGMPCSAFALWGQSLFCLLEGGGRQREAPRCSGQGGFTQNSVRNALAGGSLCELWKGAMQVYTVESRDRCHRSWVTSCPSLNLSDLGFICLFIFD